MLYLIEVTIDDKTGEVLSAVLRKAGEVGTVTYDPAEFAGLDEMLATVGTDIKIELAQ